MNKEIEIVNYEDKDINLETNKVTQKSLSEILAPKIQAMGLTPEQVKLSVLNVVAKNPALEQADKASTMLAVATALESKLSIDPMDGEVAFIPYSQGVKSVTQIQVMWKGYRGFILRESAGVIDCGGYEIKEGDIKEWDFIKNEIILNDNFWNKDFSYQRERMKKPTIGYLGIVFLDEKIYGQKNFGTFMDLEEIESHKKTYGSKTKINDFEYGRKTVVKKVIRDNKHKFIWNKDNQAVNTILEKDQSAVDEKGNRLYVENESN